MLNYQQKQEKRQSLKNGHSFLMNDGKMRKDTSWKRSNRHQNHLKEEQKDAMGFKRVENQFQPNLKCFRCRGIGHMSRQCTSKPAYAVKEKKSEESEGVGAEVWCGRVGHVIGCVGKTEEKMPRLGETGRSTGEARVHHIESKAEMPVEKQLKLEVGVRGRKAFVVFQLVENSSEVLLLGTNAFKSIGVELKWKAENAVARAAEKLRVPPQSCLRIDLIAEADMGKQVLLESNEEWMPASLCPKNDEGNLTVRVSNWRNEPLLIKKNQIVGVVSREWKVYEGKEGKEVNMLDIDKKPSLQGDWRKKEVERLLNENGEIPSGMFRRIISEFSEVFAIEDSELTQTGMVECKIE
uniref:CCHC-type domain-containing protein n=1 Tax=Caenorhabditis japonica TaxID=281687 RepID=A0A8R1ETQ1_CAEJA